MKSSQKNQKTSASRSIGFKLKYVSQLITRRVQADIQPYGLTPFHLLVLSCLSQEDNLPSTEIADRLNEVGATMTGVLDRMEERGLVSRLRDASDRRIWRVSLTAKGRELFDSLPDIGGQLRTNLTHNIDKGRLQVFESVLDELIETAENMVREAGLKGHKD